MWKNYVDEKERKHGRQTLITATYDYKEKKKIAKYLAGIERVASKTDVYGSNIASPVT